eukprot:12414627-Karenia_brevis.AAC.1
MPWQQLRPTICLASSQAMVAAEAETRSALKGLQAVDTQVFQLATKGLEEHPKNIVTSVATLSSVEQHLLHRFDCTHPKLVEARVKDASQEQLDIIAQAAHLPPSILHGIPPLMQLLPTYPFWSRP